MAERHTKRLALRLSAAAVAVFLTVAGVVVITNQSGSESVDVQAALQVCDRQDGYDLNCIESVFSSIDLNDPTAVASQVLQVASTNDAVADSCHSVMHTLGKRLAGRFDELGNTLGTTWSDCGFGLLHGVFENISLPADVGGAATTVSTACDAPVLQRDTRMRGECLHALGHAIYDQVEPYDQAVEVCATAFPGPAGAPARIGCYTGLAMKARDKVLGQMQSGLRIIPTVAGFSEVGSVCSSRDAEFAAACAPGFVQVATDSGPDHVRPFLDWCSATTGGVDEECFRQAGVYMGHFKAKFSSVDAALTLCAPGSDASVNQCRLGFVEGFNNRGEPLDVALEEACAAYQRVIPTEGRRLCDEANTRYRR